MSEYRDLFGSATPEDEPADNHIDSHDTLLGRLHADGQAWRREPPSEERFVERMHDTVRAQAVAASAVAEPVHAEDEAVSSPPGDLLTHGSYRAHPPARWRGLLALAATLIIVALLAAVFRFVAPGRGGTHISGTPLPATPHSATATPTTQPGPNTQWVTVNGVSGGTPAIAPSDPRIIYEVFDNPPNSAGPAVLKRSGDGGATWQTLPIPKAPPELGASSDMGARVSVVPGPADPHLVFLAVGMPYENCPTRPKTSQASTVGSSAGSNSATLDERIPSSGYLLCSFEYRSTNGGYTWQQISLPIGGQIAAGFLYVQGNRLYALDKGDYYNQSLVRSDDGGATWQRIDAAFASVEGYSSFLNYMPTSTGSTVFAATTNLHGSVFDLWRSDDAGASWRKVNSLPGGYAGAFDVDLEVVDRADGTTPLLYSALYVNGDSPITDTTHFEVSADGGVTWTAAPTTGLLPSWQAIPSLVGQLADGSILVQDSSLGGPNTLTFYSWKMGQPAWRQLTPSVFSDQMVAVTAPDASGQQAIWVIAVKDSQIQECVLT